MGRNLETEVLIAQQKGQVEPEEPKVFDVVILNDDYTPMDFVVLVLQEYFGKSQEAANELMMRVHQKGQAVCGTFPKDVAETKVAQVMDFAVHHNHPLLLTIIPRQ